MKDCSCQRFTYFPPGTALVPYGLPCIRELLRFLISLTNPHDRHNSEVMIHMGLQLLTVALELASVANWPSLLGLVKEELCRYLFQVSWAAQVVAKCWYVLGRNFKNSTFTLIHLVRNLFYSVLIGFLSTLIIFPFLTFFFSC